MEKPKSNGKDGRDAKGRFTAGNKGGPGFPYVEKMARLKRALMDSVNGPDIKRVIRALIEQAAGGDVAAAKVLLDRVFGKARVEISIEDNTTALDAAAAIQRMLEHYGSNGSAAGGNGAGTITRIASGGNGRN